MENIVSLSPSLTILTPTKLCLYMPIARSVCLCFSTMQRFSAHNSGSPNWPCTFANSETLRILMFLKFDKGCFLLQLSSWWCGMGAFNLLTIPPAVLGSNSVPHTPLLSPTFCTPAVPTVVQWSAWTGMQEGGSCVLERRKEMRNSVRLVHFIHNWKLTFDSWLSYITLFFLKWKWHHKML